MVQVLWIPGWHPVGTNALLSSHWAARGRLKKHDAEVVRGAAIIHKSRPAEGRRRLSVHVVLKKGQRKFDRDNLHKSLRDALVNCSLLINDSPKWLVEGEITYSRVEGEGDFGENFGTFILLEDLVGT